MKLTSKISALALAVALTSVAKAAFISGTIGFTGSAVLNGGPTFVGTTQVTSWSATAAAAPITGSFAASGIVAGNAVTFASPWVFAAATPSLWAINGFTFDIAPSVTTTGVVGSTTFLAVSGTGIVKKAGFQDTPGTFSFSTQTPGVAGQFTFSASGTAVPDGGATVALLGCALLGLQGVRRFGRR